MIVACEFVHAQLTISTFALAGIAYVYTRSHSHVEINVRLQWLRQTNDQNLNLVFVIFFVFKRNLFFTENIKKVS